MENQKEKQGKASQKTSKAKQVSINNRRKKQLKQDVLYVLSVVVVIVLTIGQLFPNTGIPSWSGIFSFLHGQSAPSSELEEDVKMSVHMLDVGQADCILVLSDGKAALIDAGENGCGERVLSYLRRYNIKKLDIAVATHPHSDHIGGMDTVLNGIPVDIIIIPDIPEGLMPTGRTYSDFLDAAADAKEKGTVIKRAEAGDTYTVGNAVMTVLSPSYGDSFSNLNDWSVALLFTCDNASFYTAGDVSESVENLICDKFPFMTAQLIKLSHHGSSKSNCEKLLNQLRPDTALISVGKGNDYGHPSKAVLKRLKKLGTEYKRTDLGGNIVYCTDGNTFAERKDG